MVSYIYILALILIVCLFVFVVNLSGNWSSGDFIRYMAGRTNRRLMLNVVIHILVGVY